MFRIGGHKVDPEEAVRASIAEINGTPADAINLNQSLGRSYISVAPILAGRLNVPVSRIDGLTPGTTGHDLVTLVRKLTHAKAA